MVARCSKSLSSCSNRTSSATAVTAIRQSCGLRGVIARYPVTCCVRTTCQSTVTESARTPSSTKRREDRLEVRLTPKAKSMLRGAALVEHKTVSAFILDKGLAAAAETLADRREFSLSAKQYDAFVAALDAPAKPRPRLERLLRTPSVLE